MIANRENRGSAATDEQLGNARGERTASTAAQPHTEVNKDTLVATIRAAVDELARLGADLVGATGLCWEHHSVLTDFGFRQTPSERYSLGVLLDGESRNSAIPSREEGWYVSADDGVMLYAASNV